MHPLSSQWFYANLKQAMENFAAQRVWFWFSRRIHADLAEEAFSNEETRRQNFARIAAYRSASWFSRRFNPKFWGLTKLIELSGYYYYQHYENPEINELFKSQLSAENLTNLPSQAFLGWLKLWFKPVSNWLSYLRRDLFNISGHPISFVAEEVADASEEVNSHQDLPSASSSSYAGLPHTTAKHTTLRVAIKEPLERAELIGKFPSDSFDSLFYSFRLFNTLQEKYLVIQDKTSKKQFSLNDLFKKGVSTDTLDKWRRKLLLIVSPDKQRLQPPGKQLTSDEAHNITSNLNNAYDILLIAIDPNDSLYEENFFLQAFYKILLKNDQKKEISDEDRIVIKQQHIDFLRKHNAGYKEGLNQKAVNIEKLDEARQGFDIVTEGYNILNEAAKSGIEIQNEQNRKYQEIFNKFDELDRGNAERDQKIAELTKKTAENQREVDKMLSDKSKSKLAKEPPAEYGDCESNSAQLPKSPSFFK